MFSKVASYIINLLLCVDSECKMIESYTFPMEAMYGVFLVSFYKKYMRLIGSLIPYDIFIYYKTFPSDWTQKYIVKIFCLLQISYIDFYMSKRVEHSNRKNKNKTRIKKSSVITTRLKKPSRPRSFLGLQGR